MGLKKFISIPMRSLIENRKFSFMNCCRRICSLLERKILKFNTRNYLISFISSKFIKCEWKSCCSNNMNNKPSFTNRVN